MGLGTIAFLTGVLLCQRLPELPPAHWALALIPFALASFRVSAVRIPVLIAAGFFWAVWRAGLIIDHGLPPALEGRDVVVTGAVASMPESNDRSVRFDFEISRMEYEGAEYPAPGRVRLSWYERVPDIRPGERWQLRVRLKQPHGFMNPAGFDYERWLFQNRIRAAGYVRDAGENVRLASSWTDHPLQRIRAAIRADIIAALGDRAHAGIITALAIGDTAGIARAQWDVFNRTSTSHLVAISGLHIGMVAALVFFAVRALWGWSGRLALYLPAPRVAAVAAMTAAFGYAALAGFSVPTQRSLVMIAVVMAGVVLQMQQVSARVLALALIAVLLFDPLAVLSAGFWLSFGAVAAILFAMNGRLATSGAWWKWGRVHVIVAVALTPALLTLFQQVALLSPLANVVAVPIVSLVVVPLTLIGLALLWVPGIGALLLVGAEWLFSWLWPYLDWLASLDIAVWSHPSPPLWTLAPALIGTAWLLAPRGWPARWLGVLWLLPLVVLPSVKPSEGEAWFTLLDVGQGLAAVIETRAHVLVYDTGAGFSDDFDAGAAVVVPFLKSRGFATLDTLVISHGDNDHIGGSRSVMRHFRIANIVSSVPHRIDSEAVEPCVAGMRWSWDGVDFSMLHPDGERFGGGNNASCVLHVATASGSVLLPGDIEKAAEKWLVRHHAARLRSDVLVAPHHGSNTSSTAAFIDAVGADFVLFPVGYRNRYGFPRPQVIERYGADGVAMLASSRHGAIRFRLGASGGVELADTYRQSARRYWHRVDHE